jgi:hypothetical protein
MTDTMPRASLASLGGLLAPGFRVATLSRSGWRADPAPLQVGAAEDPTTDGNPWSSAVALSQELALDTSGEALLTTPRVLVLRPPGAVGYLLLGCAAVDWPAEEPLHLRETEGCFY